MVRTLYIQSSSKSGTGFFIVDPSAKSKASAKAKNYYVLTNAHVVGSDSSVEITWYSDTPTVRARVLGRDEKADVALLNARPTDFMEDGIDYLRDFSPDIYAQDNPEFGDEVIATGFPAGLSGNSELSVTRGVISSPHVLIDGVRFIKTDAAINEGNSGGPLMNAKGQIIGMNTLKDKQAKSDNIGYALAMSEIFSRFEFLKNGGAILLPTLVPQAPVARYDDGSYLAILTWEENGETWHNINDDESPCIDRVWETYLGDGRTNYRWNRSCEFAGYIDNDQFYIDIQGQTYRAVEVLLDSRPY